jgi:FAD dependent oxidoreductase TIGR03364
MFCYPGTGSGEPRVGPRVDVVIVGGGILGTMHAWLAIRAGHRVVQLEREDEARGASVRNFGLVWVSGRAPGAELELALRARQLWQDVGAAVPAVGFRPAGSMTVARSDSEAAVLAEVAERADATDRGFTLLGPAAARSVNPALRGNFTAALHCERDAIVEPRSAARGIRAALSTEDGYRWLPGREVVDFGDRNVVDDHGDTHRGDLVVLATGAWHRGLLAEHVRTSPARLRRCRLQMMETDPLGEVLTTSVADGDSLRYYPAFAGPALHQVPPQREIAARHRMQMLMVQRSDGALTIGDTHAYTEPFDFDVDEAPYEHLVEVAEALLGRRLPRIRRRWAGIYSQVAPLAAGGRQSDLALKSDLALTSDLALKSDLALTSDVALTGELYHRAWLAGGTVLVTGPGGRGMTLSPAIAEQTFASAEVSA